MLLRIKADTTGYDANIAKARRTLEGFKQDNLTLGGILNQTTKSLTAAAAGFASVATAGAAIGSLVSESIELAQAGEGIRLAFERLDRPDLLDSLRQATHNTVNDIELMKQAVKFKDFRLNIDEMGTLLAFAQQKAKDTGQSVDYMVDSIVTGLGRQSLMILDNLGLSASEIKERMQETGDMTKAVSEIIQDQMKNAGDYVETAADRAAQAEVQLQNAMEELGRTFAPLTSAGSSMWNDLKLGAIQLLNDGIKPVISGLQAIGVLKKTVLNSDTGGAPAQAPRPGDTPKVLGTYTETTRNGKVVKAMRDNEVLFDYTKKTGGSKTSTPDIADFNKALNKSLLDTDKLKEGKELLSPYAMMLGEIKKNILDIQDLDLGGAMAELGNKEVLDQIDAATKRIEQQQKATDLAAQSAMNLGAALSGVEDPGLRAAGTVMSAIANIALGFAMASKQADTIGSGWGWIAWLAAGTAAMATTISTIHSLTGYAHGGLVDGSSYSGDNVPIMANAGELVLTKAMQANLANQLEGGGMSGLGPSRISGEQIYIVLNRYLKRSGQGEIMTWG